MGVRLPAEYQEVEWIENTRDKSYWAFDIDSIPNAYKVRLCNSTGESWTGLSFTESRTAYKNRFTIERDSSTNSVFRFGSYTNDREKAVLRSTVNNQVSSLCEYDNGVCKINGMTLGTLSMSGFEARALNIGGTIQAKRQTRFYYYEDDNRHLIPCYRKSDGIKGIYDRVSGLFNAGEGDQSYFTVGPDVIDSISPLMVAWRRMLMRQYIGYEENKGFTGLYNDATTGAVVGRFLTGFIPIKGAKRLSCYYGGNITSGSTHFMVEYNVDKIYTNQDGYWDMTVKNQRTITLYTSDVQYVRFSGFMNEIDECYVKNADTGEILWKKGM